MIKIAMKQIILSILYFMKFDSDNLRFTPKTSFKKVCIFVNNILSIVIACLCLIFLHCIVILSSM